MEISHIMSIFIIKVILEFVNKLENKKLMPMFILRLQIIVIIDYNLF